MLIELPPTIRVENPPPSPESDAIDGFEFELKSFENAGSTEDKDVNKIKAIRNQVCLRVIEPVMPPSTAEYSPLLFRLFSV